MEREMILSKFQNSVIARKKKEGQHLLNLIIIGIITEASAYFCV